MQRRTLQLQRGSFPGRPAFDTAFSRALLHRVGAGEAGATLRLYRPDDVVAFSLLDRARPGFPRAVAAAAERGCDGMLRLAGGRAALFHRETLAFAWTVPDPDARAGIHARFEAMAGAIAAALGRLGVDARVGEVPGEYCPGEHSVNARGRVKLMGIGQRVLRGAAHVGGVIVVRDGGRVREVLEPVYAALGFDWDARSAGSVEDEVGRVTCEDVAGALIEELGASHELVPGAPDEATLELAARLEPDHRADAAPRGGPRTLPGSAKGLVEDRLPAR